MGFSIYYMLLVLHLRRDVPCMSELKTKLIFQTNICYIVNSPCVYMVRHKILSAKPDMRFPILDLTREQTISLN